jgi:hypothetical protein
MICSKPRIACANRLRPGVMAGSPGKSGDSEQWKWGSAEETTSVNLQRHRHFATSGASGTTPLPVAITHLIECGAAPLIRVSTVGFFVLENRCASIQRGEHPRTRPRAQARPAQYQVLRAESESSGHPVPRTRSIIQMSAQEHQQRGSTIPRSGAPPSRAKQRSE